MNKYLNSTSISIFLGLWCIVFLLSPANYSMAIVMAILSVAVYAYKLFPYVRDIMSSAKTLLKRYLPKAAIEIVEERKTVDEDGEKVTIFVAKFEDSYFRLITREHNPCIFISFFEWYEITPEMDLLKVFEVINKLNDDSPHTQVVLSTEVAENGNRRLSTIAMTILPSSQIEQYLRFLFGAIFKKSSQFAEEMEKLKLAPAQKE